MAKILNPLLLLCLLNAPSAFTAVPVHEFTLDNGLKVLVREDHRAPVVVSQVWYKVGSSYEPSGSDRHLPPAGTYDVQGHADVPGGEFSRLIAANGGDENAFTSRDYTAYFQTLEKERLELSFRLEADRMRHLLLEAGGCQQGSSGGDRGAPVAHRRPARALTSEQFNGRRLPHQPLPPSDHRLDAGHSSSLPDDLRTGTSNGMRRTTPPWWWSAMWTRQGSRFG
jgi:zinc protease